MEVTNVRPHYNGAMRAFVDLLIPTQELGDVEFYGCGLFQKGDRWWINMPSREYTDSEGVQKYQQIARFRKKDVAFAWSDTVVPLVHKYCEDNNINLSDGNRPPPEQSQEKLPF